MDQMKQASNYAEASKDHFIIQLTTDKDEMEKSLKTKLEEASSKYSILSKEKEILIQIENEITE